MDSVEKGTLYLTVSKFVFFLTGYLIYFVLGRFLLTPEQFGTYGVVIALFSTINLILVTAIQQAVTKFVSEQENLAEAIKRKSLKIQLVVSIGFFLLYVFLAPVIATVLNDMSLTPLIRWSGLIFLSHPIFSIFLGCLNGLRKFKRLAALEISYSILKMLLILGLVFLGFSVFGAITGFILASFTAAALGFILVGLKKPVGSFDSRKLVLFAVPLFAFAAIQNLLLNLDLFAVKALTWQNPALLSGYYVAAQSISRLPLLFVFAIILVLFPLVSSSSFRQQLEKTRFYIHNSVRFTLLFSVPLTALIAANSREIVSLVYSSKYLPASAALSILAFSSLFYALFLVLTTVISSSGKPRASMLFGLIALVSLFVSSIALVPGLSIEGAAIASTISIFFGLVAAAVYVLLKFGALVKPKSFAKIAVAGALIYLISESIQFTGLLLLLELALMLLVYAIVLIALRELNKKDLVVFLNMVS